MISDNVKISFYIAWLRVSSEYRGLKLGYLWELLSLLFVVSFLTIVWSQVLDSDAIWDYFFYVLLGFNLWSLLSRCLDQCLTFKNRCYTEMRRGISTFDRQFKVDVFYCFLQFLLTFPVVLFSVFLYRGLALESLFFPILSLIFIYFTAYGLFSSLALLTVLYEDISRLIRMVMRVAFLMTPILWKPEMLGEELQKYIYLNPFYSYLDVFRSSLLGQDVNSTSVIIMLSLTALVFCIGKASIGVFSSEILTDIYLDKNV